MSTLQYLLQLFRDTSRTEREKGTYFEDLSKIYFQHDSIQQQEYSQVWSYAEWAKEQGISQADEGIDLVAEMRDGSGICAIQCKFYAEDHEIQKSDIDSFFTASGKEPFTRRIIIDSTSKPYSKNAENALRGQRIETLRIGLHQLAESRIDWENFFTTKKVKLTGKKTPRPHQKDALTAVKEAFYGDSPTDRGKIIMACGTGKTYTALHLVEELIGKQKPNGQVLFLVPSLALMQQTVTEWKNDCSADFTAFAACSDSQIGVRKAAQDIASVETHDLAFPACTKPEQLAEKIATHRSEQLTIIFSTYQSIEVLSTAQKKHGLPDFDLIICDEAHRTTGATAAGEDDESAFVQVHSNDFIKAEKRLYMTATPRVYSPEVKEKAEAHEATLYSMDNEEYYGKVLFHRGFAWAVEQDLLCDYKVLVLAVDEQVVSDTVQKRLNLANNQLKLDDATKIIGCYKALTKQGVNEDLSYDPDPIKRALAFCKTIKSSQTLEAEFAPVVEEYLAATAELEPDAPILHPEVQHVDGSYKAKEREKLLSWLKAESDPDACRILTNAKCLSEGVDVPALDAILFLHPRKSQVDVVQSVGRVMRTSPGKKLGYVILPVVIPAGMAPDEALKKNEPYQVVWQVLNALRSHDERLDARINQASLGEDIRDAIEVVAVSHTLPGERKPGDGTDIGGGSAPDDSENGKATTSAKSGNLPMQSQFVFDEFSQGIMAKIVKKCGTRDYWEDWAKDIAEIAQKHITRITSVIEVEGSKQRTAFLEFLAELHDDLNDAVTEDEAVEMIAQHLITKPVFDALFTDHNFTEKNPVSLAMQKVLEALEENNIDKEAESLQKFYDSVKRKAADIKTSKGRQQLVVQLYDKFFRTAFKKMTERLGIVYTPVEVVDFIIHSVNDVLQDEFGQTLGSKGVHIIDPFTGTGTFITRLLQSGLIKPEELEHKYKNEIHANEIVLLAYYIAAINIEATYHELVGAEDFSPFEGICLTDTFRMVKGNDDMLNKFFPINSERRQKQIDTDVKVVIGNPPYSVNDNVVPYKELDQRITDTYVARSSATLKNSLYDSYIRSIRWASDRVGDSGVIAFVTNGSFIDSNVCDGLRASLTEEFSSIYIFNLRGNQRTSGELSRKEGGKIFGSGSRTPVAVSLFIKNPKATESGKIHYHDIGDYLTREEKLTIVTSLKSINGLAKSDNRNWDKITPNDSHDWINQRDEAFEEFTVLGDKTKENQTIAFFKNYSSGVKTNRDAWCYNFSEVKIHEKMSSMIKVFNTQIRAFENSKESDPESFYINDAKKIHWTREIKNDLRLGNTGGFTEANIRSSVYRPFCGTNSYFCMQFNNCVYQMPQIFPTRSHDNLTFAVTGIGESVAFSTLITDSIPNLHAVSGGQCFPLYLYEKVEPNSEELDLASSSPDEEIIDGYRRKSAITDEILAVFHQTYGKDVTKEDIFYYVYGILHSPEYRDRFSSDLKKMLPRIPLTKETSDYQSFTQAGRDLAHWHLNYETVEPHPDITVDSTMVQFDLDHFDPEIHDLENPFVYYKVEKMKFGKACKEQKAAGHKYDKTTIIYNNYHTLRNIPLEAYDYVVNGKPAIEWLIDRYQIKTDKKSGITNNPNDWCKEHNNPTYILDLLKTVAHVSTQTNKIVASLPALNEK